MLYKAYASGDAGRFESGDTEAAAGQYNRDDICPRQDRARTANEDTLLYGVEVKFYNSKIEVDENLQTAVPGLYALGDGAE